jgi:hypothetical protein
MSVSIAIIGLSGLLGKPVLEAAQTIFADQIKFPIKALTTSAGKVSTDKVEYIVANYDEPEKVAESVKNVDVIIDLIAFNPAATGGVDKVISIVKPKLYIPSQFGIEITKADKLLPGFAKTKTDRSVAAREQGIKTVDIITNFFAVPGSFLYELVAHTGIDTASKTITAIGSLDTKFAYATIDDIGKSIVSVAIQDPAKLPDTVRIQSGTLSFKDVKERWEKDHNATLTVSKKYTKEEALEEAQAKFAKGFEFADFYYYLHNIAAQGVDNGSSYSKNENELVNPGESSWKWEDY